jgi:hypothetical protein
MKRLKGEGPTTPNTKIFIAVLGLSFYGFYYLFKQAR